MAGFSKTCPVCKEIFDSLGKFTVHIKENHSDIPPEQVVSASKEQKWKLREDVD